MFIINYVFNIFLSFFDHEMVFQHKYFLSCKPKKFNINTAGDKLKTTKSYSNYFSRNPTLFLLNPLSIYLSIYPLDFHQLSPLPTGAETSTLNNQQAVKCIPYFFFVHITEFNLVY